MLVFSTLITEPSPVANTALDPMLLEVMLLSLMLVWLPSMPSTTAFCPWKLLLSSLVVLPVLSNTLLLMVIVALFLPMKEFWSLVVLSNRWCSNVLLSLITDVPVKVLGLASL